MAERHGSGRRTQTNGAAGWEHSSRPANTSRASATRAAVSRRTSVRIAAASPEATRRAASSASMNGVPPVIILWAIGTRLTKPVGQLTQPARRPAATLFDRPPRWKVISGAKAATGGGASSSRVP